jgi:hypothetical protein
MIKAKKILMILNEKDATFPGVKIDKTHPMYVRGRNDAISFGYVPDFETEDDKVHWVAGYADQKAKSKSKVRSVKEQEVRTFTVTIETDNEAFADNMEGELSRILSDLSKKVEGGKFEVSLKDINGNTVGSAGFGS